MRYLQLTLAGLLVFSIVFWTNKPTGETIRRSSVSAATQLETRLKMKEEFAHQPEENPGAFENALQEIKVARDGRTYPADYRMKAFRSAEKALSRSTLRKGADAAPLSWKERGPGNVSGRTRAIVVDPDDPQKQTGFVQ